MGRHKVAVSRPAYAGGERTSAPRSRVAPAQPAVHPVTGGAGRFSPGQVLHLQRTLGNGAVTSLLQREGKGKDRPSSEPVVQATTAAPLGSVQRAVVLLDDNPNDYALQKVLTGLDPSNLHLVDKIGEAYKVDTDNEKALIPYDMLGDIASKIDNIKRVRDETALVGSTETIYIVGHGAPNGMVWTAPDHGGEVRDFGAIVKAIKDIVPDDWSGEIKVLTCNSEKGTKHSPSVVEKLTKEWGKDAPTISGQGGYAYGMGPLAPGEMAVLNPEYNELYKAEGYDAATAKHLLARIRNDEKAAKLIGLASDSFKEMKDTESQGLVWESFVEVMKGLEKTMKAIVEGKSNKYGVQGLNTQAKAAALETDDDFQDAIRRQKELFDAFELWA